MEGTTEAQLFCEGKKRKEKKRKEKKRKERITIPKKELLSLHINISLVFKFI